MTTDTAALVKSWVVAISVAGFVLVWSVLARTPFPASTRTTQDAVVATSPVATTGTVPAAVPAATADPQLVALARRERALRIRAAAARRRRAVRWATYRRQLAERQSLIHAIQSAPAPTPSASTPVFTTSSTAAAPAPAAATTRSS